MERDLLKYSPESAENAAQGTPTKINHWRLQQLIGTMSILREINCEINWFNLVKIIRESAEQKIVDNDFEPLLKAKPPVIRVEDQTKDYDISKIELSSDRDSTYGWNGFLDLQEDYSPKNEAEVRDIAVFYRMMDQNL
jgi:hypothetical protein